MIDVGLRITFTRALLPLVLAVLTSCATEGTDRSGSSQTELANPQRAYADETYEVKIIDRSKFAPSYQPAVVTAPRGYSSGTIVVDTGAKQLFLIGNGGKARRYGIAVGATGHAWAGKATIGRMAKWPAWHPTDDMRTQARQLPGRIAPGTANPLGARALYLYTGGSDTLYRIHGTSEPWTIGTEASSGCIRMLNEDVIDLYQRVSIGTSVVVVVGNAEHG